MPTYWSTVVLLLPMGAAALTFTIAANSTVQLGSDPAFRGRVMALYMMCFMGGTPIGAPLVGVISDALGPRAGVIVGRRDLGAGRASVAAVVVSRRRGLTLRTQVGEALPHPLLAPAAAAPAGERSRRSPRPSRPVPARRPGPRTDTELVEIAAPTVAEPAENKGGTATPRRFTVQTMGASATALGHRRRDQARARRGPRRSRCSTSC